MSLPVHTRRRASARSARPGLAAVLLVVSLALLAGLSAIAVDLGLVFFAHEQLRAGCEAAALAGAPHLMNRSILYPARAHTVVRDDDDEDSAPGGPGGAESPDSNDGDDRESAHLVRCLIGDLEYEHQLLAARRAAVWLASRNFAAGDRIHLDENCPNELDGDVVLGWVAHPERLGAPLEVHEHGPCNTLLARAQRGTSRGNPLTLRIGQMIGMPTCDVTALARATLDQRVYGFRAGKACVPVVPIAVPFGPHSQAWPEQALCTARPLENDCYAVEPGAAHVTRGSDGIPELCFRVRCAMGPEQHGRHDGQRQHAGERMSDGEEHRHWSLGDGTAVPLAIGESEGDAARRWARWLKQLGAGLSAEDLADGDGAIQLGNAYVACRPGGRQHLLALHHACHELQGQLRAWPLCVPTSGGRERKWEIVGFAAGRIVAVEMSDDRDGECILRVQPDVMTSSQALAGACARPNPWIAKVTLTQ